MLNNCPTHPNPTPPFPHTKRAPALEVRSDIADIGLHMYLKMMLVDNFVHGDLHPGNILVRPARGVVNRFVCRLRLLFFLCGKRAKKKRGLLTL